MKLPPLRLAGANFWPKKIHPSCQILTNLALCALYTVARDNLAQDGQKLCPWLDSLILAHTDQKICLSFSLLVARKRVR